MAIVGYARVSSSGQKLDIQLEKLTAYGCTKIFQENQSGLDQTRPELKKCLDYLREGDTFVVTRLDRLARSAIHLGNIAEQLDSEKINFVVIEQSIDTTHALGRLMFQIIAGFAEFEWSIRKERQTEGIAKALANNIKFGPKHKLTAAQVAELRHLRQQGMTIRELMNRYQIGKTSVYRLLNANEQTATYNQDSVEK